MDADLRLLLFFAVSTLVALLVHLYLALRLFGADAPRASWVRPGRALLGAMLVSMLGAFVGGRYLPPGPGRQALEWVGFVAMGLMAVLFPLTLARDLAWLALAGLRRVRSARGASAAPGASAAQDALSRRELLRRGSSGFVLGASSAVSLGSFALARQVPRVVEVRVPVEGLHADLEGLAIAQLSDMHVGPMRGRAFVEELVARTLALQADLIALTGDFVDGTVAELAPALAPLARLRAPLGVFAVTGNHEYYWDAPAWIDELRRLGLDLLVDEHRVLRRGEATLVVAGVPDQQAAQFVPEHRSDPALALAGAPPAALRLLLAHQPRSLFAAVAAGYDLQLSGHTHGGQLFPWTLLIHLAQPVVQGLARFERTWVYVNRGSGTWGPPMRSNGQGEITLLRLARA